MADFNTAYQITVIGNEGGYRNVNYDRGGETYRGISRVYNPGWSGWIAIDNKKAASGGLIPTGSIFNDLELAVKNFYREHYWNAILGDSIHSQQLANLIFDYNVQSGEAKRRVQESVNKVITPEHIGVDGIFGSQTISAINSANEIALNNQIKNDRLNYYTDLLHGGILASADWNGILNRLARFPYLKETIIGGGLVAILIIGAILLAPQT